MRLLFWIRQFFSSGKAHKLALYEVLVVCALSLVPLFGLAIIDELHAGEANFEKLFTGALSSGQLYLYSFSLFGTLFWLCQKEHENFDRFEPRVFLMFAIIVPCIVILIVYAQNPSMSKPLGAGFVKLSYAAYSFYVLIYYVLLVFDHLEPPPIEAGLQSESNELIKRYNQRKRGH